MKIIPFILTVVLVIGIAGCAKPVDKTVDVESIEITGKNITLESWTVADFGKKYPNASSLCADTEAIVVGKVLNVKYTDDDANAITYYDFLIEESWEGEFNAGDTITIAESGGFIRGNIFAEHNDFENSEKLTEDDLIKSSVFGMPFPKEKDKYVLFLSEWTNGVYCPLGNFMGKYFVDGKKISRHQPEDEPYLYSDTTYTPDPTTLDELQKVVSKSLKNYTLRAVSNFDTIKDDYVQAQVVSNSNQEFGSSTDDKIVSFYDEKLSFFSELVAKTDIHPTMLFLGTFTPLHVAGGDMFQSILMETAGGVNVAQDVKGKGNFTKVAFEQIAKWDPEIIYIPVYAAYTAQDILSDPAWQELQAVKNGRVYQFPGLCDPWDRDYISSCLGVAFIVNQIYPDRYSYEQLQTDAKEFYELQGYSFAAEEMGLK